MLRFNSVEAELRLPKTLVVLLCVCACVHNAHEPVSYVPNTMCYFKTNGRVM